MGWNQYLAWGFTLTKSNARRSFRVPQAAGEAILVPGSDSSFTLILIQCHGHPRPAVTLGHESQWNGWSISPGDGIRNAASESLLLSKDSDSDEREREWLTESVTRSEHSGAGKRRGGAWSMTLPESESTQLSLAVSQCGASMPRWPSRGALRKRCNCMSYTAGVYVYV